MNANRRPLAAINHHHMTVMAPMISERRKPRLTYSSVIQSLVRQLTERSPYLLDDENDTADPESDRPEIALLYRDEVLTGELLGQGNFSNVFEVASLRLRTVDSKAEEHRYEGREPASGKDHGAKAHKAPEKAEVEETQGHCEATSDTTTRAESVISKAEQMRLHLRENLKREDGSCAYAVKCLKPELLEDPSPKVFLEAATDLVIEAKYLSKFNHENILKVKGLAQGWEASFKNAEYDSFFIVVDRIEETLNQRIKRWRHGEFPEENTTAKKLPLARQLASALNYLAERELLFRDCKPQNIGLHRNADNSLSVKLFDFGFCRQLPVVEQARDDVEDTPMIPIASSLPSGETVYMMSGKGTRRYMAPECLLKNRYNLKADVYSWAMVVWELLTLHKPFYKYTKDQHTLLVCEGGDRPPLESSTASLLWPSTSFHSISASLSSMPSTNSADEDSINFQQIMTEPIKDLLTRAWHQDVSLRLSMKEVLQQMDVVIDKMNNASDSAPLEARSDLSNTSGPTRGYSCLSAEYGDVRDIVAEFAHDLHELPFLACFGFDSRINVDPETTTTVLTKSSECSTSGSKGPTHCKSETNHDPEQGSGKENASDPTSRAFSFPEPQLKTLIVQ